LASHESSHVAKIWYNWKIRSEGQAWSY
jgi:hypothetical protein